MPILPVGADMKTHGIAPFCWYRITRDITDEFVTVYSDGSHKPNGDGWQPLYTKIDLTQLERREAPKWNYSGHPSPDKDCRKLVTLHQGSMWWIGIRAWNSQGKFWQNGNDPETASVHAWMDLPDIARSFWDKGVLIDMDSQFQKIADKQEEK